MDATCDGVGSANRPSKAQPWPNESNIAKNYYKIFKSNDIKLKFMRMFGPPCGVDTAGNIHSGLAYKLTATYKPENVTNTISCGSPHVKSRYSAAQGKRAVRYGR
eukprot:1482270-Pleurochrysis_carterae.AAC.2